MNTVTFGSEEARTKFRDILDGVSIDKSDFVIERHGKPTAVVVNYGEYEQWLTWKRRRKERHDQIRSEMDAGHFYTQEQVDALLQERGMS